MEVGQFRRNSIENFLTPINDYSIIDVELDMINQPQKIFKLHTATPK